MITLIDGDLYQWDTGRVVLVEPDSGYIIHEVHFTTKKMDFAYVVKTYEKNGAIYCAIPNILLQQYQDLVCYEVRENDAGEESTSSTTFDIIRRNRPDDYVYTEPEKYTYKELEKRVGQLEESLEEIAISSNEATAIANEAHEIAEAAQTTANSFDEKKAPIENPVFSGVVKVGEDEVALKSYVEGLFANLVSAEPGIVDSDNPLPETGYKAGQHFRVAEAGTYAGVNCEVGDLVLVVKNYNSETASNEDFMVLQANIDGAVTSASEITTVGEIVVFDSVTGKVIKGSSIQISSLSDAIAKAHEHSNKIVLDSYDKSQSELLAAAKTEAETLVAAHETAVNAALDNKADKATTLAGYGITDAYTTTELDGKLQTITDNLNTKISGIEVDTKIASAKEEAISAAATDATSKANTAEQNAKDYADGLNTAMDARVDALEDASHSHDNKTVLDGITATKVSNWDDASSKAHSHENKTVLDDITSAKVSNWDAAEQNAKTYADGLNTAMATRMTAVETWQTEMIEVSEAEINALFA